MCWQPRDKSDNPLFFSSKQKTSLSIVLTPKRWSQNNLFFFPKQKNFWVLWQRFFVLKLKKKRGCYQIISWLSEQSPNRFFVLKLKKKMLSDYFLAVSTIAKSFLFLEKKKRRLSLWCEVSAQSPVFLCWSWKKKEVVLRLFLGCHNNRQKRFNKALAVENRIWESRKKEKKECSITFFSCLKIIVLYVSSWVLITFKFWVVAVFLFQWRQTSTSKILRLFFLNRSKSHERTSWLYIFFTFTNSKRMVNSQSKLTLFDNNEWLFTCLVGFLFFFAQLNFKVLFVF